MICKTMISSKILFFNNQLLNFPLGFRERIIGKIGTAFGILTQQTKTLARLWHVVTFIGTLACKDEKLARFWHVDT